jgi:hypothetical protein
MQRGGLDPRRVAVGERQRPRGIETSGGGRGDSTRWLADDAVLDVPFDNAGRASAVRIVTPRVIARPPWHKRLRDRLAF